MKMPRSQNESENVQFVQELAEVDGPFEAPININFRNLIKLELPSLVWNRGDTCPKKMKITNTGHTVIISGKWKCERPYLTGGPLCGKYVFSQIHFHWGQDDCGGSEHQICGEGFPLEMHVTHFKTEYLTQECALREKDGMVVVVYLFKLQEEPNDSLKKIINSLSYVKQPSTSYGIDPRPILTLCNPFSDDYFMYWGSVVTSTCAHILLWIICREPFGISREQVNEFRKIMDSYHQPICKNSRDIQPLHKRNVFHVNSSKHIDEPLLPIKKILGCYCKGGEDNAQQSNDCSCQGYWTNQEEVEERYAKTKNYHQYLNYEGEQVSHLEPSLPNTCYARQTFCVHKALVPPLSMGLKRSGSDPLGNYCCFDNLKKIKSEGGKQDVSTNQVKLVTQSCCFFPEKEVKNIKSLSEKRKTRERKRPFNSLKAFTQIMHSLEVLKNHTFKKLKEIESINQEIKDVKPFCQDAEDKTWIRKIEKIMTRQKRFTIKSSQGCLHELKKLAKDCNFDKFFDAKALPVGDHNQRITWLNNGEFPAYEQYMKGEEISDLKSHISKHLELKFSSEAQKLIQSFFEDIKDGEDIQNAVKKDLSMKQIKSIACKQDPLTIIGETKGFITQKMFIIGNLGNRFFTEVITDNDKWRDEKQTKDFLTVTRSGETKASAVNLEKEKKIKLDDSQNEKAVIKAILPIHKTCIALGISKTTIEEPEATETVEPSNFSLKDKRKPISYSQETITSIKLVNIETERPLRTNEKDNVNLKSLENASEDEFHGLMKEMKKERFHRSGVPSNSNISAELTKFHDFLEPSTKKSTDEFWKQKSKKFGVITISSKGLYGKTSSKKLTNVYSSKRNKKRKSFHKKSSHGFSSTSREERQKNLRKSKWKKITRPKFKIQLERTSDSTSEFAIENSIYSPNRKMLKLDYNKFRAKGENFTELETPKLKYLKRTLSHEYQIIYNTHESRLSKYSTTSTNRTRPSSVDSIFTKQPSTKEYALSCSKNNGILLKKMSNFTLIKHKNRSTTNMTFTKEIFSKKKGLESVDDRQSNKKNSHILQKSETLKILEEMHKTKEFTPASSGTSIEAYKFVINDVCKKKNEETYKQNTYTLTPNTTTLESEQKQTDLQKLDQFNTAVESPKLKSGSAGKKIFLQKKWYDVNLSCLPKPVRENFEISKHKDLNKNLFMKDSSVADDNLKTVKNSNNQICLTPENKNSSEEALNSVKKSSKRKKKKNSLCCKRSSKHAIKKNFTIVKKRQKSEKKLLTFLDLTDEEQLKIISVNVAKYLTQKLAEETELEAEKNIPLSMSEKHPSVINTKKNASLHEVKKNPSLSNIEKTGSSTLIEKVVEIPTVVPEGIKKTTEAESPTVFKTETKPNKIPVFNPKLFIEEKKKKPNYKKESKNIKPPEETQKTALPIALPRSSSNFIQLNKQMAGRYKRLIQPAVNTALLSEKENNKQKETNKDKEKEEKEKKKNKEISQKKEKNATEPKGKSNKDGKKTAVIKSVNESKPTKIIDPYEGKQNSKIAKPKIKHWKKRKEIPIEKVFKQQTVFRPETPPSTRIQKAFPKAEKQVKNSPDKTTEFKTKKVKKKQTPNDVKKVNQTSENDPEANTKKKSKSVVKENSETIGSILEETKCKDTLGELTASLSGITDFVDEPTFYTTFEIKKPEILKETKTNILELNTNEATFKKELEYFIKLQMCLDTETPSSLENPTNFEAAKDLSGKPNNLVDLLQYLDQNKKVLLIETKNCLDSSSSYSIAEKPENYTVEKELQNKAVGIIKNKEIVTITTPNCETDMTKQRNDGFEESNSESNYDCKISITLNATPNPMKTDNDTSSFGLYNCLRENCNSQTTTCLEGSSSQSTTSKLCLKKQTDSDIPLEMKQKLLELFEGEIKRKVGISNGGSSGNSSNVSAVKFEDSDGNNKSQSSETSSDNIEVLAQISNTMKQYLEYLKERKKITDEEKKEFFES